MGGTAGERVVGETAVGETAGETVGEMVVGETAGEIVGETTGETGETGETPTAACLCIRLSSHQTQAISKTHTQNTHKSKPSFFPSPRPLPIESLLPLLRFHPAYHGLAAGGVGRLCQLVDASNAQQHQQQLHQRLDATGGRNTGERNG